MPSHPRRTLVNLLLGKNAFADFVDSIKLRIGGYGIATGTGGKEFGERDKQADAVT